MSAASELRETIKEVIFQIGSSLYWEGGEYTEEEYNEKIDAILDAVIESHPEYKLPDDGYGDDDSFNRGWNEGISEFLNFLESAKTQKGEE